MLNPEDFTLICPRSDLESETIWNLAKNYNIDVINGGRRWGVNLSDLSLDISTLKSCVVIIEIPGRHQTQKIESTGRTVIHIDHHEYSDEPGGNSPLSSLEQFCQLIGHSLTEWETLVAVNDQEFIPGLLRHGCDYSCVKKVRDAEAEIRGVSDLRSQAFAALPHSRFSKSKSFSIYCVDEKFSPVFLEVAQFPSEEMYSRIRKTGQKLALPDVVVIYCNDSGDIRQIEIAAGKSGIEQLRLCAQIAKQYSQYKSWNADRTVTGFFGIKPAHNTEFIPFEPAKRLLAPIVCEAQLTNII